MGQSFSNGESSYYDAGRVIQLAPVPLELANGTSLECVPVTKDATITPIETFGTLNHTLRDVVNGQDWLLRRLVGKVHVNVRVPPPQDEPSNWRYARVAAGFFVARAIDGSQEFPDLSVEEVDPFQLNNIQNPWIWRRSWILRNPSGTQGSTDNEWDYDGVGDFPVSNSGYGSVADGPHLDSKVKRRIHREERLWFVLAAQGYNGNTTSVSEAGQSPVVQCYLDLRIFGALRRSKNSGNF